tara:strand:+ start:395 stop:694 length:300 start_codon:yes stop_codon:yes gene_type:complete
MANRKSAFTEVRNVTVSFTYDGAATNAPIDFHKAVATIIERNEEARRLNPALADIPATKTSVVGANRNQVHIYNLTVTQATGTYVFDYIETVPDPSQQA